jgi:hypothetical protein
VGGSAVRRGRSPSRDRDRDYDRVAPPQPERGDRYYLNRNRSRSRSRSDSRFRSSSPLLAHGGGGHHAYAGSRSPRYSTRPRSPSRHGHSGDIGSYSAGLAPEVSAPDVSLERDGSMRIIGRILGFRVGMLGRDLELQVAWMDGAVGWHHPKIFTWGRHNYRPMLRVMCENAASITDELARAGFTQFVDTAGHLRDLDPGERHPGRASFDAAAAAVNVAAAAGATAGVSDVWRPDRVCWGFRRGHCSWGDKCRFEHLTPDVPRVPAAAPAPAPAAAAAPTLAAATPAVAGAAPSDSAAAASGPAATIVMDPRRRRLT